MSYDNYLFTILNTGWITKKNIPNYYSIKSKDKSLFILYEKNKYII